MCLLCYMHLVSESWSWVQMLSEHSSTERMTFSVVLPAFVELKSNIFSSKSAHLLWEVWFEPPCHILSNLKTKRLENCLMGSSINGSSRLKAINHPVPSPFSILKCKCWLQFVFQKSLITFSFHFHHLLWSCWFVSTSVACDAGISPPLLSLYSLAFGALVGKTSYIFRSFFLQGGSDIFMKA